MFQKGKYIVVTMKGNPTAVIFPSFVSHWDMAARLGFHANEVDSAGFVSVNSNGTFQCYGKSDSLGKESKGERDVQLVTDLFGDHLL